MAAVGPVAFRSISQVADDEWVGSDYAVNMTMPSSLYLLRIPPLHYYIYCMFGDFDPRVWPIKDDQYVAMACLPSI